MMRSTKQEQLKHDLHNELKLRYREFFESKLAVDLLKHAKQLTSINKISSAILKLLESNKNSAIDLIASNPLITTELCQPYFGSCYESKQEPSSAEVLEKIESILKDGNSDLTIVMQVHCIFIHRIHDHLEKRNEKSALVNKLFPNSLFSKENRSRAETKEHEIKTTTQLGISRHSVFSKMVGHSNKHHLSAIEKFTIDYKAVFFKSALEKFIPIICGPSGHTGSLMLGANLYGNLTPEEQKEYALISFAFLAAGGNHSFHEVMIVASRVGIHHQEERYMESIPLSIRNTEFYKRFSKTFPEFLEDDHDPQPSLNMTFKTHKKNLA